MLILRHNNNTGVEMQYTVYKLNIDGRLSHKEHLNNLGELNEWLANKYGKFASVLIVQDQTGKIKVGTDNGVAWEFSSTSLVMV